MRHIPEDELHAYLDQGLSRTQCVEIESHLADCVRCRATRDQIAALRDRTTALLSRLAPPPQVPPSFDSLRRQATQRASERRRRLHLFAWAASLVAAVGLGWTASSIIGPRGPGPETSTPQIAQAPGTAPASAAPAQDPVTSPPPAPPASSPPARQRRDLAAPVSVAARAESLARARERKQAVEDSIRTARLAVLDPVPAVELTRRDSALAPREGELDGVWRTVSWDGARAEAGERLPHIDGLPVLRVQVQAGEPGKRSVMVVAQRLASGQVIQTIEGPAADVSQLLARRGISDVDSVVLRTDSAGQASGGDHAMAMQLGDRMLAITGALPSDSLRAMIRRLNAEMRAK